MVLEQRSVGTEGFHPEVLKAFFIKAEVVFGGHRALMEALEHVVRDEFVLAVACLKLARYGALATIEMLEQVTQLIYSPICPHIQQSESVEILTGERS